MIMKVDEGRNWYSAHRGRLWIHAASKVPSDEEVRQVQDFYKARYGNKWYDFRRQNLECVTQLGYLCLKIFIFLFLISTAPRFPRRTRAAVSWAPSTLTTACRRKTTGLTKITQFWRLRSKIGNISVFCFREKYPDGESASPYVFVCRNHQELLVKYPMSGQHKIYKLDPQIHQAAKKSVKRRSGAA